MIVLSDKTDFFIPVSYEPEIVIEKVKWTPISPIHEQIIQIAFVNRFSWSIQKICYLMEQYDGK